MTAPRFIDDSRWWQQSAGDSKLPEESMFIDWMLRLRALFKPLEPSNRNPTTSCGFTSTVVNDRRCRG
jgi:hypothetical protein